jgi:hypothetical protein
MTGPWDLLGDVTEKLRAQSLHSSMSDDGSKLLFTENQSAVAATMLLLSCHFEWAVAVYKAAVAANPAWTTSEKGQRLLRQTVLRAQRTSLGYSAVKALFVACLREVLSNPDFVSHAGHVTIPIETARARLGELNAQVRDMGVVWCYDEVQVLLTESASSDFFQGMFDAFTSPAPGDQSARSARPVPGRLTGSGAIGASRSHRQPAQRPPLRHCARR